MAWRTFGVLASTTNSPSSLVQMPTASPTPSPCTCVHHTTAYMIQPLCRCASFDMPSKCTGALQSHLHLEAQCRRGSCDMPSKCRLAVELDGACVSLAEQIQVSNIAARQAKGGLINPQVLCFTTAMQFKQASGLRVNNGCISRNSCLPDIWDTMPGATAEAGHNYTKPVKDSEKTSA